MTKTFILDTNVLLADPQAVLKFEENTVVIPLVVLEEMDKQKSSGRDIARDARAAIRQLNTLIGDKDPLVEGVDLPNGGGKLFAAKNVKFHPSDDEADEYIIPTCNDDQIINICKKLQMEGKEAVLVSNDINMRLKAKGMGLNHVQEYRTDVIIEDPDLLPKGFVYIPSGWLGTMEKEDCKAKSCGFTHISIECVEQMLKETGQESFALNDWMINEEDHIAGQFEGVNDEGTHLIIRFDNWDTLMARKAAGIAPRDIHQAIAINALLDPNIDIVILDAKAGSGKTLLAMAAGTEMVKGKKSSYRMEEIIVGREQANSFREIGFLKGGVKDKLCPWLGGVTDNMEVISRETKNKKFHPSLSIKGDDPEEKDDAFIKLENLGFMRGRSINYRVLIVDELQNNSVSQAKTVLSRAGENCKVIIMGNNGQIDADNITPRSSALTYCTEKFHGQPFAQVVQLQSIERSRLAEFVEKEFD